MKLFSGKPPRADDALHIATLVRDDIEWQVYVYKLLEKSAYVSVQMHTTTLVPKPTYWLSWHTTQRVVKRSRNEDLAKLRAHRPELLEQLERALAALQEYAGDIRLLGSDPLRPQEFVATPCTPRVTPLGAEGVEPEPSLSSPPPALPPVPLALPPHTPLGHAGQGEAGCARNQPIGDPDEDLL
jgi:hypothetical protein